MKLKIIQNHKGQPQTTLGTVTKFKVFEGRPSLYCKHMALLTIYIFHITLVSMVMGGDNY